MITEVKTKKIFILMTDLYRFSYNDYRCHHFLTIYASSINSMKLMFFWTFKFKLYSQFANSFYYVNRQPSRSIINITVLRQKKPSHVCTRKLTLFYTLSLDNKAFIYFRNNVAHYWHFHVFTKECFYGFIVYFNCVTDSLKRLLVIYFKLWGNS